MEIKHPQVAVAGHICLDIIPTFDPEKKNVQDLMAPGKLVEVGSALFATGGAVSNTGLALHRLGVPTLLIGKVGQDPFGRLVLDLMNAYDPLLTKGIIMDDASSTSYTIVISPPQTDRLFFHCTGANDTFGSSDIPYSHLDGIRLFHFGYPPLMRNMYQNNGRELRDLFRHIKSQGIMTSLDMAKPDPSSEAGRIDWYNLLEQTLPFVDIFQPSLDEILYMMDRDTFERLTAEYGEADLARSVDTELLDHMAKTLLDMGSQVIAIKLGEQGLYLQTGPTTNSLTSPPGQAADLSNWANRQLLAPCFNANVVGTTGAGDCTVAGLLAGILAGMSPAEAVTMAVGVGACCTEAPDATSGIPIRDTVYKRIESGWEQHPVQIEMRGWRWDNEQAIWKGPLEGA